MLVCMTLTSTLLLVAGGANLALYAAAQLGAKPTPLLPVSQKVATVALLAWLALHARRPVSAAGSPDAC